LHRGQHLLEQVPEPIDQLFIAAKVVVRCDV
jgi:hypothetical protein